MNETLVRRSGSAGKAKTSRRKGPMTQNEQTVETTGIDEAIERMERLYRAVTGRDVPAAEAAYAPIPAEKDPAQHVEERLNQLLRILGGERPGTGAAPSWTPPISAWETDSELVLSVDLPGVKREQVEVTIQGNLLTVSGQRSSPAGNGARLRLSESAVGAFRRAVLLSGVVRGAEPRAEMKDGILEIRIPKEPREVATSMPVSIH
jgi:HSP20 family protein